MTISVSFLWGGLSLSAEVDYTPYVPARTSGPVELCYPAEGGDCDIIELTCEGSDALFLMDSKFADDIKAEAAVAAGESIDDAKHAAEEDRAADRAEYRRLEEECYG